MAKRFKNLEAALSYLRAPSADENAIAPDAPAGSQLAKYQEYAAKKRAISYTRDAGSKPGNIKKIVIQPFAVDPAETLGIIVPISKRAQDGLTLTGLNADVLNHTATLTGGISQRGFIPARATVNVVGTGDGTPENSKITGRKYQKKNSNSYTLPFGQGSEATASSYAEVKAAIVAAVSAGSGNRSVSFTPERY
jgi:hypothetical protein